MKKKHILHFRLRKIFLVLLLPVITIPFALFSSMFPVAAASGTYSTLSVDDQIKVYETYALFEDSAESCIPQDTIQNSDIANYKFFTDNNSVLHDTGSGVTSSSTFDCTDGSAIKSALATIGMTNSNPGELLCELGYTQTETKSQQTSCGTNAKASTTNDTFVLAGVGAQAPSAGFPIIDKGILTNSTVFGKTAPTWTDAMTYKSTLNDFISQCAAVQASGSYNNSAAVPIPVVDSTGAITTETFTYTNNLAQGSNRPNMFSMDIADANGDQDCAGTAAVLGETSATYGTGGKYAQYLNAYQASVYQVICSKTAFTTTGGASVSAQVNACADGEAHKTTLTYCTTTYYDGYHGSTLENLDPEAEACYVGQGNDGEAQCIARNDPAVGYENGKVTDANLLQSCIDGSQHTGANYTTYCATTFPVPDVLNGTKVPPDVLAPDRAACVIGQSMPAGGPTLASNGGTSCPSGETGTPPNCQAIGSSCAIANVGWIVCPIIDFMAQANDGLYSFLSGLLAVDTSTVSSTSTTNNVWGFIRNIANVGLVIVFMIIIFSQITSFGITNYGVKKMLPRLIVAAILINISFLVCQIAVDVSNIIGSSINPLFNNIAVFGPATGAASTTSIAGGILAGGLTIGGAAAVGAAVAPASLIAAVALLAMVLVAALLAVLVTVLILAARKVVIIVLVVLAPLAFLAMMLPNTESLFKQWRKILIAMLLVYPEVGLLFAGSNMAAKLIASANPAGEDSLEQILGLVVLFVPLLATPILLQSSLKAVPVLGNLASKLAGKANSNLSKSIGKNLKPLAENALANRTAGLGWRGGDRYKRGFLGRKLENELEPDKIAKLRKDGQPYANNRMVANPNAGKPTGKKIPSKDGKRSLFGRKVDADGHLVTPGRTASQIVDQSRKVSEKSIDTNKTLAEANYGQMSTDRKDGLAKAASRVTDRAQSAGVLQQSSDEIYKSRLKSRQLQRGSADNRTFDRLEDAQATSKTFDARLKQEQLGRVQSNAVNTAAAAIGIAGEGVVLNIGHGATAGTTTASLATLGGLSQIEAAANAGSEATEMQIQRANKESGVMAGAIQQKKEAEAGIKAYDTQQDEYFKTRQAREAPLKRVVEQQDAADRGIKTLDKEQEARLEKVAHATPALHKLQQRENRATIELENLHLDEKNEMEASRLAGGANAAFTAAAIESQSEADRIAAELKKTQQEAGFGKDQVDADGNSLFGGENTGNRTPEEVAAAAQERLDRIKRNKQKAIADGYAGTWAEGGIGLALDKEIAEDQQGEMARRAAGTRIELDLDENGNPKPLLNDDGSPRLDSNKQPMYKIKGNENIVARSFQRLAADTQGDADALKSQYEREGLNSNTMLSELLHVDGGTGAGEPERDRKKMPIAEEVAVIQRIAESGDIGGGVSITEYVASLSKLADEATTKSKDNPNDPALAAEAKAARERAKLVSNGMMNGFAKNPKGKPAWTGGSDEAKWIEGTHSDGPKQQVVNAFGGGKLSGDKLMNSNYEQLRPMNKYFEELSQPGGIEAAIKTARDGVNEKDFPPGTPERAVEEQRVEKEFKDNFSATLLTLDDLLDNPKYANRLETRQRTELEKTRATFDKVMEAPDAPLQPPEMKDPDTGEPIKYRRRAPREYYTTPRTDPEA